MRSSLRLDSLRSRLTVVFLLLTIIPLVLVGSLTGYRSAASLEQQSIALQDEVTARVGRQLIAFIEQRVNQLLLLDELLGLTTLDLAAQKENLSKLLMSDRVYQELVLLDALGREQIRLSRTDVVLPTELGDRSGADEFVLPTTELRPYFSPVRFDLALREPLLKVSIPIVDRRTGEIAHVLVAEMRFKAIWDLLAEIQLPGSIDVYVVN